MDSRPGARTHRAHLYRPIFLLGSHKSGTSLLRSLLDGTPGLAVLPRESHVFQFGGYRVDYALRRARPRRRALKPDVDRLIERLDAMNRARDRYSDLDTFSGFDLDVVRTRVEASLDDDPAEQAAAYLLALYEAWAGNPVADRVRLVEKSVEHAEFAILLRRYFPDASFVHIVRDPHATLVALRRARSQGGYPYMGRIVRSLDNSYSYLFNNQEALDRYEVIRYEDLVTETAGVMAKLASRLDLSYHDGLLRPTTGGRHWGGNSTSGQRFEGVSRAPLEAWKRDITPYEVEVVRRIATPVLNGYGYVGDGRPARATAMKRNPGERPSVWARNRALLARLGAAPP